ncbi:PREDICTED: olfactory receptor 14A16-like [Nipponia nippon]|nr:PREDICTED: olfactory receptor 14A16-like [Nipponia nippon]
MVVAGYGGDDEGIAQEGSQVDAQEEPEVQELQLPPVCECQEEELGSRACVHMAAAAWGNGFLNALLHTTNTFSLLFCNGNAVDQFFCEIPQILKLSCSHSYLREVGLIMFSLFVDFGCFVFIVVSYVQIFRAVLRIPSQQGRHKAFSTCIPHMAVVSLFLITVMFAYLKPPSISSPSLDLVVAVLYSVVPPAVNPLIYSMRNKEIKNVVWKWAQ